MIDHIANGCVIKYLLPYFDFGLIAVVRVSFFKVQGRNLGQKRCGLS